MSHTLTRSRIFFLVLSVAACLIAGAQITTQAQNRTVAFTAKVIPQPQQISLSIGRFYPGPSPRIVLADPRSAEDQFAAQDFAVDFKEMTGIAAPIRQGGGRKAILIGLITHPRVRDALNRANIDVPIALSDEGYILVVTSEGAVVAGKSTAGTFYGLQTLKQLVRFDHDTPIIPTVHIIDWPTMRWRAVSDDISRGPVPTVDYIKRQIRTEAYFKLNMHSFYMEHTFASESHPLIGPTGGSLTPAEIRELVAYARRYHVELVPEQQTFGHLHKALRLEKYAELAETPYGDVLSPQQPGSYKLIADWYRELNELFPGQFFHIGADETFELGDGQSREAARARGVGAIYFEHLDRVREVLQPYKRRLMFWGDIALHHPELIGNVPKDMIAMNWQYGTRDDFGPVIKPFKDAGLDQFVCPGASNWNQIFPNLENATKNITNFVRDGQKAGALGMMNTTWDDDGETLFETAWYPIVLGAAASWQAAPLDNEQFDRNFDWAFFGNDGDQFVKATRALGSVATLLSAGTTDELFWRDPFTSQFQIQARSLNEKTKQMRLLVEDTAESLSRNEARARRNRSTIAAMRLAAERFDHLGHRMETVQKFSDEYWNAYLNLGDRTKVRKLRYYSSAIYNNMRELAEELSILKESYRQQWLAENRPYWLDSVLARYDQMILLWLAKSRAMDEALRNYQTTSTLPNPEEFGLGPRPVPPAATPR